MILLTGWYEDADPDRNGELLECLRRNLENQHICQIHLFVEESLETDKLLASCPLLASSRVRLIGQGQRVTYQDLFAYANRHLSGQNVVIANADIFFDQTLERLKHFDLSGKLLCLSRWDVQPDGSARFFDHPSSQDAWVFQAPICEFRCNWSLGLPGCDNRLACEAERAGLQISNPSRSVVAYHLHLSGVRRYSEEQRLTGPTKSVPADFLEPPRPALDLACASVAINESMGYTITRLATGASSHNNDLRPFLSIPEALAGLEFTQVVSMSVSPVEIEFITSGKVYVLAGNDWDGYYTVTSWLIENGFKESLPLIETERGNAFEVWSIVGEAGAHFVIPTQAMLATDRIFRKSGLTDANAVRAKGRETIFALTSLPSSEQSAVVIRNCIDSWRRAGLHVLAFNHPSDIAGLGRLYDVDFAPVEKTTINVFGRHFIPIKAMLDWAAERRSPTLIINADIQLRVEDWEMKRLRWLTDAGLCYFVRYNHDGDLMCIERERHGIDAFLFHGRHLECIPECFLSMGQPVWDYWLPQMFLEHHLPVYAVEYPAAFHQGHPLRWSWENWRRCAVEFARITGEESGDHSFQACVDMSVRVRQDFDRRKVTPAQSPIQIKQWVQRVFSGPGPKTFIELGSHKGDDTVWMAQIPEVTIHALEPDPRNHQAPLRNVTVHRAAIADYDGRGMLTLSKEGWGREWTHSSSIKRPRKHLQRFPVTFGEAVEVDFMTLDTFCSEQGIGPIDFLWADIQGAEAEMIRGGRQSLAQTRYLYTEYSDDELYENQPTLSEILEMLPDFRVVELWPDDVLLENKTFKRGMRKR